MILSSSRIDAKRPRTDSGVHHDRLPRRPGERVDGYDVTAPPRHRLLRGVRRHPRRRPRRLGARAVVRRRGRRPRCRTPGIRAEYPLDLARAWASSTCFNDGIEHPEPHPLLAARRRPGQHGGLARRRLARHRHRRAGRPGAAHPRALRQPRAAGAVAAARRARRGAGGVRADRARPRLRLRVARDRRAARRRRVGARRREEVDRQRRIRRHHVRVGARRRRRTPTSTAPSAASSSSRRRPGTPAP